MYVIEGKTQIPFNAEQVKNLAKYLNTRGAWYGKRKSCTFKYTTSKKAVESIPKPLTTRTELFKNYPIRTLNTNDVNRFKEMVTLSNNVAGLLKQCIDTDTSVQKGNEVAQAMLDGKIKGAAMQKVTANLFLPLNDMKDVAKKITGEVETLKQANIISKGQLSQRYDEYIDSMKEFFVYIFNKIKNSK